jgi:hypothetical protein
MVMDAHRHASWKLAGAAVLLLAAPWMPALDASINALNVPIPQ